MGGPILMTYVSCDMLLHKEVLHKVPFGGCDVTVSQFEG